MVRKGGDEDIRMRMDGEKLPADRVPLLLTDESIASIGLVQDYSVLAQRQSAKVHLHSERQSTQDQESGRDVVCRTAGQCHPCFSSVFLTEKDGSLLIPPQTPPWTRECALTGRSHPSILPGVSHPHPRTMGLWNYDCGFVIRHQGYIGADHEAAWKTSWRLDPEPWSWPFNVDDTDRSLVGGMPGIDVVSCLE